VTEHIEQLAVHQDMLWRVDVPLPEGVPVGAGYTIRYTVESVREGAGEGLLVIDPVRGSVAIPTS